MSVADRRVRRRTVVAVAPVVTPIEVGTPRAAPAAPRPPVYVGLVTRAIAFAVDAAIIDVVAIFTAAVVALVLSVVSVPQELRTAAAVVGGVAFVLWTIGYFVTFWSTTGQTPGSRLMRIRVRPASGDKLPPRRALVRFVGLTLAALPLFAGFFLILVDDRRRGLQDRLARTVVVEDADPPEAGRRPRRPALAPLPLPSGPVR